MFGAASLATGISNLNFMCPGSREGCVLVKGLEHSGYKKKNDVPHEEQASWPDLELVPCELSYWESVPWLVN